MTLSNQRKDERNRQRAYGEPPREDAEATDGPAGYRANLNTDAETADRGAFRDDGDVPHPAPGPDSGIERKGLKLADAEDVTGETFPETYNADIGAVSTAPAADDPRPDTANYGDVDADGFSIRQQP